MGDVQGAEAMKRIALTEMSTAEDAGMSLWNLDRGVFKPI
jgi:hypothetical protein